MNNQKDNYMDFVPEISVVDKIEPSLTTIHAKSIEKALIDAINYEMKQIGNTDVKITNIRPFITDNKQFAYADVSYDEPVATLEGHFNFDKSRFTFITYKYVSDGGWEQIVWTNDLEYVDDPRVTIMSNVFIDKDNSTAIYHTPITLASQPLENCLVSLT